MVSPGVEVGRAPRAARGTHRRAKRNGATATARQRRNGNQIMLLAFGAASSSPSTPPPPSPPPAIATAWLHANQGCRQTRRDPSISHAKVLQANQDCRQIRGAQGSYSLPSLQRIPQGVHGLSTKVRDGPPGSGMPRRTEKGVPFYIIIIYV